MARDAGGDPVHLEVVDVESGEATPIAGGVPSRVVVPDEGVVLLDAFAAEPGLRVHPLPFDEERAGIARAGGRYEDAAATERAAMFGRGSIRPSSTTRRLLPDLAALAGPASPLSQGSCRLH